MTDGISLGNEALQTMDWIGWKPWVRAGTIWWKAGAGTQASFLQRQRALADSVLLSSLRQQTMCGANTSI